MPRIAEVAGGEAAQVEDQQDLGDLPGGALYGGKMRLMNLQRADEAASWT